ncbi:hypothetical protein GW17_00021686, partial [Ensete ventricosum]
SSISGIKADLRANARGRGAYTRNSHITSPYRLELRKGRVENPTPDFNLCLGTRSPKQRD